MRGRSFPRPTPGSHWRVEPWRPGRAFPGARGCRERGADQSLVRPDELIFFGDQDRGRLVQDFSWWLFAVHTVFEDLVDQPVFRLGEDRFAVFDFSHCSLLGTIPKPIRNIAD